MAIFVSPIQNFDYEPLGSPFSPLFNNEDYYPLVASPHCMQDFFRKNIFGHSTNRFRCPNNQVVICKLNDNKCKKNVCGDSRNADKCCKQMETTQSKPFEHVIDAKGFEPSELKVKIVNRKVIVMGFSSKEGKGFYNIKQLWKEINLPRDISSNEITSSMDDDGKLMICLKPREKTKEQPTIDKKESLDKTLKSEEKFEENTHTTLEKTKPSYSVSEQQMERRATGSEVVMSENTEIDERDDEKKDEKKPVVFQHTIDVSGFNPDNFNVTVKNGFVLVNGSGIVNDNGVKCLRQTWRKFKKPDGIKDEDIKVILNDEGKLILTANNNENLEKIDVKDGSITFEVKREKISENKDDRSDNEKDITKETGTNKSGNDSIINDFDLVDNDQF